MRPVKVLVPDRIRLKLKTAWLNGACVALVAKKWANAGKNAPFNLTDNLPTTQGDMEIFANWAVNMAYHGYPGSRYEPTKNLLL